MDEGGLEEGGLGGGEYARPLKKKIRVNKRMYICVFNANKRIIPSNEAMSMYDSVCCVFYIYSMSTVVWKREGERDEL